MKCLLVVVWLLSYQRSPGQIHQGKNCKIEIYLLKKILAGIDTITKTNGRFLATQKDLEDTPFITNAEILTYSILKDSVKQADTAYISQTHVFEVLNSAPKKINSLDTPLLGGRQFAVVANNKIVYSGYFWNSTSSFKWDWITAYANMNWIIVLRKWPDDGNNLKQTDERNNLILFDCLRKTKRMIE